MVPLFYGEPAPLVMVVLETRGLGKRYGAMWALRGVDLDVQEGEVFGFLGPNGAGKTTFTKCVTGFIRPEEGKVRVKGLDSVESPHLAAHHIGTVPDQYDFYPTMTGREHLDYYARLHGMDAEARSARIEEVLEDVGMEGRADKRTKTYSHGMKQRICIGQAILHKPALIFFDEPTNGLDPRGAYELRQMIRGLAKGGTTIFLNSHLLHEVEQTCDRVAVINQGRIVTTGGVADLRRGGGAEVRIRVANPGPKVEAALATAAGAKPVRDQDLYKVPVGLDDVPDVVRAVVGAGGRVLEVVPHEVSLEDVFLRLTEDA